MTGGTGGIGTATCRRLAKEGYLPVIGYRGDRTRAGDLASETQGQALALDMESADSIDEAAGSLAADGAGLAGVILAASPSLVLNPFGKITSEDMTRQWQVNVAGPQRLLALLIRLIFKRQKAGTVLAVLSQGMGTETERAATQMGAYIIAKFGMSGLMAVVAAEHPWLRVRSVKPGFTDTNMLTVFDERFLDILRERGQLGSADDVATEIVQVMRESLTPEL